jgi:hypothetical protein
MTYIHKLKSLGGYIFALIFYDLYNTNAIYKENVIGEYKTIQIR